jgi:hypothetical protein
LNFLQKLQLDFPACFLHVASVYFIFLIFILKKSEFLGITQNWVMTGDTSYSFGIDTGFEYKAGNKMIQFVSTEE